jgi:hypothetical protein
MYLQAVKKIILHSEAMPQLRQLVGSLSLWRPRFTPRSVHVGFEVDKVSLGKILS